MSQEGANPPLPEQPSGEGRPPPLPELLTRARVGVLAMDRSPSTKGEGHVVVSLSLPKQRHDFRLSLPQFIEFLRGPFPGVTQLILSGDWEDAPIFNLTPFPALLHLSCVQCHLKGFHFPSSCQLETLQCSWNNISDTLDLSQLFQLRNLGCSQNQITQIVFPNYSPTRPSHLMDMRCDINKLSGSLNLSKLTSLIHLNCSFNELSSLSCSDSPLLVSLICFQNHLSSILFHSKPTSLQHVDCHQNRLTGGLDLSTLTQLKYLNCSVNLISQLDLPNTNILGEIYCSHNKLDKLIIPTNARFSLNLLMCSRNKITELNLAHMTCFTSLDARDNRIHSLDVTNCHRLQTLLCPNNLLWELPRGLSPDYDVRVMNLYGNYITDPIASFPQLREWMKETNRLRFPPKILLVGPGQAGKSRLFNKVTEDSTSYVATSRGKLMTATKGYQFVEVEETGGERHKTVWIDFGGQDEYMPLHPPFFSDDATMVVVFVDVSRYKCMTELEQWLILFDSMIKPRPDHQPVRFSIVGTHLDCLMGRHETGETAGEEPCTVGKDGKNCYRDEKGKNSRQLKEQRDDLGIETGVTLRIHVAKRLTKKFLERASKFTGHFQLSPEGIYFLTSDTRFYKDLEKVGRLVLQVAYRLAHPFSPAPPPPDPRPRTGSVNYRPELTKILMKQASDIASYIPEKLYLPYLALLGWHSRQDSDRYILTHADLERFIEEEYKGEMESVERALTTFHSRGDVLYVSKLRKDSEEGRKRLALRQSTTPQESSKASAAVILDRNWLSLALADIAIPGKVSLESKGVISLREFKVLLQDEESDLKWFSQGERWRDLLFLIDTFSLGYVLKHKGTAGPEWTVWTVEESVAMAEWSLLMPTLLSSQLPPEEPTSGSFKDVPGRPPYELHWVITASSHTPFPRGFFYLLQAHLMTSLQHAARFYDIGNPEKRREKLRNERTPHSFILHLNSNLHANLYIDPQQHTHATELHIVCGHSNPKEDLHANLLKLDGNVRQFFQQYYHAFAHMDSSPGGLQEGVDSSEASQSPFTLSSRLHCSSCSRIIGDYKDMLNLANHPEKGIKPMAPCPGSGCALAVSPMEFLLGLRVAKDENTLINIRREIMDAQMKEIATQQLALLQSVEGHIGKLSSEVMELAKKAKDPTLSVGLELVQAQGPPGPASKERVIVAKGEPWTLILSLTATGGAAPWKAPDEIVAHIDSVKLLLGLPAELLLGLPAEKGAEFKHRDLDHGHSSPGSPKDRLVFKALRTQTVERNVANYVVDIKDRREDCLLGNLVTQENEYVEVNFSFALQHRAEVHATLAVVVKEAGWKREEEKEGSKVVTGAKWIAGKCVELGKKAVTGGGKAAGRAMAEEAGEELWPVAKTVAKDVLLPLAFKAVVLAVVLL